MRPRFVPLVPLSGLLCLLAAAALFAPCLRPGFAIFGRDTVFHDYGMLLWGWGEIRDSGRIPLWNPWLFGGIPTLGSFALCPFYPTAILFVLLPFPLAFSLQYIAALAIGGGGMTRLAGKLGLGAAPALAAGLLFSLSGHMATLAHAGHLQKALALSWAPWLFAAAENWRRKPSWRSAAWIGVPFGLMLLASHAQVAYVALLGLGIWFFWRGIPWRPTDRTDPSDPSQIQATPPFEGGARGGSASGASQRNRPDRSILLTLPQLLFALLLGAALSAIQMLPGLEMAPLSNRAGGVSAEEAARTSYPPRELLEYILPGWFGSDAPHASAPYRGSWGAPMNERIVSDYFGVSAIVLALFALFSSRRKDRWLWAAIAALGILIGVGAATPAWGGMRAALPGFAEFRSPAVAMALTTIGGIVLAAMGLQEGMTRAGGVSPARIVLAAGGVILAGAGLFTVSSPPVAHALRFLGATVILLQLMPLRPTIAAMAMILVLAFDTGLRSLDYIKPLDTKEFSAYLQSATPQPVRADPDRPVRILQKGGELVNSFMNAGVGSVHGYHPIVYARYQRLIERLGFYDPKLAALFHQNWLLWPPDEPAPPGWAPVGATGRGILYRREGAAAYVLFPPATMVATDTSGTLSIMAKADFDPSTLAIVGGDGVGAIEAAQPAEARGRVLDYRSDEVEVGVQSDRPRLAVFADIMAPGWEACVLDEMGSPELSLDPLYADSAFRAVEIPAGVSRIRWSYRPFSFRLGAFVTLTAGAGLLAGWAGGRRKAASRRR